MNLQRKFLITVLLLLAQGETCRAKNASAESASATLVVRVTNETTDGLPVGGDQVIARLFQDGAATDTQEAEVDQAGQVVFADLPTGPNMVVAVTCKHEGVLFQAPPVSLHTADPDLTTWVRVYDISTDAASLSVTVHHIIIKRASESLQVTEYMNLKNSSDRVVKPDRTDDEGRSIVLPVMLPQGYRDFQASSYFADDALVFTDQGFYDTMSVAPGEYSIGFTYHLDIAAETLDFSKEFSVSTADCVLFLVLPEGRPEGIGASVEQITMANGIDGSYYRLGSQGPGDVLQFRLTGFTILKTDRTAWVVLPVVFLLVLGIAMRRLNMGRQKHRETHETGS